MKTLLPYQLDDRYGLLDIVKRDMDQGRDVLRTRFQGGDALTRITHVPLDMQLEPLVRSAARGESRATASLPADLPQIFEGYRVRAAIGDIEGLPPILDGGLAPLGDGTGLPYVTLAWVEGQSLHRVWMGMARDQRGEILRQLAAVLDRLHALNALHGDVKPENVIVTAHGVHLIDFDTMRQVGHAGQPSPIFLLTRRYGAPEQNFKSMAYLASDLFSFGCMVALLMGEKPPGDPGFPPPLQSPWDRIMRACLREKPQDRPPTAEVLRAAAGEAADLGDPANDSVEALTTRVPDPRTPPSAGTDTDPVDDRSLHSGETPAHEEPRESTVHEPATGLARWAVRLLVGLVLLAPPAVVAAFLAGHGAARDQDRHRHEQEAQAQVDTLQARLEEHKTVYEHNGATYLASLIADTEASAIQQAPAEVQGMLTLARIWQQGWHLTNARWAQERFEEGDLLTLAALEAGETPEALLARATLTGAACRLLKSGVDDRSAWCDEARERATAAIELTDDEWLQVEAWWVLVMMEASEANRQWIDGNAAAALAHASAALDACDAAEPALPSAPINGLELVEDCTRAAASARDMDAWLHWSRWMLDNWDGSGRTFDRVVSHIHRSGHRECSALGGPAIPVPPDEPVGGTAEMCGYMTMVALGCDDVAESFLACEHSESDRCLKYVEQRGVPWGEAKSLQRTASARECELDRR